MKDAFSQYHPVVNFLWFLTVILFTMFFMHPMYLGISLICSVAYAIYLNGKKSFWFLIKYMIPLMLVTALLNPAFNHRGVTIIGYLWSGNPITLESIIYGMASATMLVSVICWFSCFNTVVTSDKTIYLFGRIVPSLSLLLSMTMSFVPRFKHKLKAITNGQRAMGRDPSKVKYIVKISNVVKIMSILITGALENAIITADSMKSRGYGIKGRTVFSIFHFTRRDKLVLIIVIYLGLFILWVAISGYLSYQFFPSRKGMIYTPLSVSAYMAYGLLCLIPLFINIMEDYKWKVIQSKI